MGERRTSGWDDHEPPEPCEIGVGPSAVMFDDAQQRDESATRGHEDRRQNGVPNKKTEAQQKVALPHEAPPGFEPGMADLQSAALGHLATAPDERILPAHGLES